ncbi:uncharacterized protein [Misgurnus anguillicaudatus]|uniref:uncharacterized protein isoform X1 n=1 Tax=Misgurnus anguillicaudatus TaxID=75329 RepID=UPI003CCF46BB
MKLFCILSYWIFLAEIKTSTTDEISLHGYTGQHIIVSCSHAYALNNRKYFCRDPCKNQDILVSSDRSPNRRFALKDYGTGMFTVTITDLQESDSGIYWCGVDRVVKDTYHEVNLRVSKVSLPGIVSEIYLTTQTDSTSSTSETSTPGVVNASSPVAFTDKDTKAVHADSVLYAVGAGLLAVIVFSVVLVCIFWYKKRVKTSAGCVSAPSTHTANDYKIEESNCDYENDPQERPNATTEKSKNKTKGFQRQTDPVYVNMCQHYGRS